MRRGEERALVWEGKGTNHHLNLLHRRALLNHKSSFLNAVLAVPQTPRLAVGDCTVRTSVLSDFEFRSTVY